MKKRRILILFAAVVLSAGFFYDGSRSRYGQRFTDSSKEVAFCYLWQSSELWYKLYHSWQTIPEYECTFSLCTVSGQNFLLKRQPRS